ncbi:MAG: cytochrome c oxidase subunit II [Acidobacteriota bacterium]|nr:cytochrome c oxidase subunit II [Acidobacteriota bacterium]
MLPGLILVILTVAGCVLFAAKPAWFPVAITVEALAWDRQFTWTLWITGTIFIGAQLLLAWTIVKGRKRKTASAAVGHGFLEITWVTATAALFIGLSVAGSRGWAKIPGQRPGEETIEVHAHQFAWSFRYPGPDRRFGRTAPEFISDAGGNPIGIDPEDPAGRDDTVTATLRIPAQRDVLLLLHSRDVIHDFFVRELRTKQDIVPGMEIPLELHVNTPGTYEIACAELCGLGHSQMRSVLIAMPPEAYDRWKRQH